MSSANRASDGSPETRVVTVAVAVIVLVVRVLAGPHEVLLIAVVSIQLALPPPQAARSTRALVIGVEDTPGWRGVLVRGILFFVRILVADVVLCVWIGSALAASVRPGVWVAHAGGLERRCVTWSWDVSPCPLYSP